MGFRTAVRRFFSNNKLTAGAKPEQNESPATKKKVQDKKGIASSKANHNTNTTDDATTTATNGSAAERPLTPNEQVVAEFVRLVNAHESFRPIFSDRADLLFKEASMTLDGFLAEWEKIFLSFPDFSLRVESGINEQPDGTVKTIFCVGGTHTGAPYAFGPFPEIEATNIKACNDPEQVIITIEDGKIKIFAVEPLGGDLTGPPGLYTQIGGIIF